jgi:Lhr-like helicase
MPPQVEGWPPIARGRPSLSGRAGSRQDERTRVIYISPLKALEYGVERWDGEPALGSAIEDLLVERGFRSGRAA